MSIVNKSINNGLWWKLLELLLKPSNNVISMQTKKMLLRIQKLIHGNIKLNEDDFDDEMHFIREDELEISLSEAATGIKSFACIIRLLENGYLDKNTLLIIDEPEAHLHPQWIVEYARILVLLSKELGVRILIASHNPDMVAAIQAIGEKEGLKERITFYQAIPTDTMYQYEYKNLGFEVTEIFKSFNIALSRIQDYGRIDN
jgi:predicted ATPase